MARIRSIKPEFPQSESIGRLSRDARLLFIELWTVVDDSGRARAASRLLASLLFPYDDDAPGLIDGWLIELERESCIVRYAVDGNDYLQVCNWLKHQKIDKPSLSRLPEFVESSRILAEPSRILAPDLGSRILDLGPRSKDQDQVPVLTSSDGATTATPLAPKKPKAPKAADPRREEFIDDLKRHWDGLNNGTPEFAMDGRDGKQIDLFLAKWPHLTQPEWRVCLRNRKESSNTIPAAEVYRWVGRLAEYSTGPMNTYNRMAIPGEGYGQRTTAAQQRTQNTRDNLIAAIEQRQAARATTGSGGGDDADGSADRGGCLVLAARAGAVAH